MGSPPVGLPRSDLNGSSLGTAREDDGLATVWGADAAPFDPPASDRLIDPVGGVPPVDMEVVRRAQDDQRAIVVRPGTLERVATCGAPLGAERLVDQVDAPSGGGSDHRRGRSAEESTL